MRVSVVQCRGMPYEIGRRQGRIFAASRRGLNFRRSKVRLPDWFDMHAGERFYARFATGILEEISGIASTLDTSLERACLFFGNGKGGSGRTGTLHTIATEPSSRLILAGVGGDASAVRGAALKVDFRSWTEGEDLSVSELTGVFGGLGAPSCMRFSIDKRYPIGSP